MPNLSRNECGSNNAVKPVAANASPTIRCNFEFVSNINDKSDSQFEKQDVQRTSTEAET
jgi:hypothetical protein